MRAVHLPILVLALGAWAALGIAAAAASGAAPAWIEAAAGFLGWCPHRAITGDPCALCGTTTAARLLLAGDVTASLALNPLALGLAAAAITQPIYRLARTLRPRFAWREELAVDGAGFLWLAGVLAAAA